jgi:aerobic-type carbon monoxide dehydrogenase small subunit (CoxS/CutS family)
MAVTDGIHMSAITLSVNGTTHRLDVDPTTPLLYVLSEDLRMIRAIKRYAEKTV